MYIIKSIGEFRFPTQNVILPVALQFYSKMDLLILLFLVRT